MPPNPPNEPISLDTVKVLAAAVIVVPDNG
jgi:hypothetical protein